MGKLSFLESLEEMISTGEVIPEEGKEEGIKQLHKIKEIVEQQLIMEIYRDITAYDTAYYAPEHSDWQHFLVWLNGEKDYAEVLRQNYTNEVLEELWQYSHISENMTEKEIKKDLALQIGQLKMLSLLDKIDAKPLNPQKMNIAVGMKAKIKARITGLYNILYE